MKIPVFVSAPTTLNPRQEEFYGFILKILDRLRLEPRALGRTDFPNKYPVREVFLIAQYCFGGIVLGFEQIRARDCIKTPGADKQTELGEMSFPTPWNNLEAGMLFALNRPILIFREKGVTGGVFDRGATDGFVFDIPEELTDDARDSTEDTLLQWQAAVRSAYYTNWRHGAA